MAKRFSELRAKMSPDAQARAHAKAQAMLAEMPLDEECLLLCERSHTPPPDSDSAPGRLASDEG